MHAISRRSFIAAAATGLGTIPFLTWLDKHADAQAARVRYNIQTPIGDQMAARYATAVKALMALPAQDPRSWTFLWYTHWVRGDTTKEAEIARIYPDSADPRGALALETWSTCQPHATGSSKLMFLPWHRMFVYFYERLLRSVLADSDFTLPYWNYSPDSLGPYQTSIPPQFRARLDPLFSSLYRSSRISAVNSGRAIDYGKEVYQRLHLAPSMSQTTYAPVGAILGFNNQLNSHVHGNVHTLVGNSLGMANVKWAGNDPIFWMHHSNIDRIWESWNKAGFSNPATTSWLNRTFVFVDELGQRVAAQVRDFTNPALLGYSYDSLETPPPPPPPPPAGTTVASNGSPKVQPASSDTPVAVAVARKVLLGQRATRVLLVTSNGRQGSFDQRVRYLRPGRRLYLVLEDLYARMATDVVYDLYLNLPSGAGAKQAVAHWVGDLNFFDAVDHKHDHNAEPSFVSYDITDTAQALLVKRRLGPNAVVTIVPAGTPAANARPEIGRVSIVEQ
jgi:tyrosinase